MTHLTDTQITQLRRNAKRLAREENLTYSEALDRQAADHGYGNWSQLMKRATPAAPAPTMPATLPPRDLLGLPRLKATRSERRVIMDIANRYRRLVGESVEVDGLGLLMDLEACHCNGCPLDLEALLAAPRDEDVVHDVAGIGRYLNRETGKLEEWFRPRYAARSQPQGITAAA